MAKIPSKTKQADTSGYPAIEELIEQKNPDLTGMLSSLATLEELAKEAKNAKEKAAAKHACIAYQQFFSLFENLLKVKKELQENKASPKNPAK